MAVFVCNLFVRNLQKKFAFSALMLLVGQQEEYLAR